jgi:hypothetical protein
LTPFPLFLTVILGILSIAALGVAFEKVRRFGHDGPWQEPKWRLDPVTEMTARSGSAQ